MPLIGSSSFKLRLCALCILQPYRSPGVRAARTPPPEKRETNIRLFAAIRTYTFKFVPAS